MDERMIELLERQAVAAERLAEALERQNVLLAEVSADLRRPKLPPLVVGTKEAARILYSSEDRIAELVDMDVLATVPGLSVPKKRSFAVVELQRFAATGMTRTADGRMRVVS